MLEKTSILQNLKSLDGLYRSSTSQKKARFYSKLAILELCGWIEKSQKRIIRSCAKRNLIELSNRDSNDKYVIQKTSGFSYKKHFRKMLIHVIGMRGVERIERSADSNKLHVLKSTLGSLVSSRNIEAHTYTAGTTERIDAPSKTLENFEKVYDGLKDYEKTLKNKGF